MKHLKEFNEYLNEEEIKQGDAGDPYEYKKDGEKFFTRKKGSSKWIELKGDSAKSIKSKFFSSPSKAPVSSKDNSKKPIFKTEPYRLTQYTHDDRRYQRDTYSGYAQQNIKNIQTQELKAQKLVKGIVPIKKDSGIKPHYRIFGDFLMTRKEPVTSSDFTREELKSIKDLIIKSKSKLGDKPTNIDFPAVAGIEYSKLKGGEEKQTGISMPKSVSYVLGNAQVSDKGSYYLVKDIYDFNNYYNHPEKYSLANSPSTIKLAIEKLFSGNLVQGVEELASYYQKLGYKGIPVSIEIPKNLA